MTAEVIAVATLLGIDATYDVKKNNLTFVFLFQLFWSSLTE